MLFFLTVLFFINICWFVGPFPVFVFLSIQNVMPLSAGLLRSQRSNATPQCPPRIQVQHLNPVSWTRVPDRALEVMVDRPDDCRGWRIQCSEALQVISLQIPDENRLKSRNKYVFWTISAQEVMHVLVVMLLSSHVSFSTVICKYKAAHIAKCVTLF